MPARHALLIGNSTFRHEELARLSAPANDVRELAALLEDPEIGGFKVELKLDISLVDGRRAIKRLFDNCDPDDLVLLYYSGHGLLDVNGRFHLAMTETDPAEPEAGSIDEAWLRGVFDRSRSRRQLAILDCCHSGAFIPGDLTPRDAAAGPILTEKTFDPTGHGRFIMAATTATTSAFEQGGRSLYTRHLVEGLKGGAAAPEKTEVTVLDLHAFVKRRVAETAPAAMRPQLWQDASLNPDAQHLAIARNPCPRPKLPEDLVNKLWSENTDVIELAIFKLTELAEVGGPLAADARKVLAERLNAADKLSYTVGARIAAFIGVGPGAAALAEAETHAAEAQARAALAESRAAAASKALADLQNVYDAASAQTAADLARARSTGAARARRFSLLAALLVFGAVSAAWGVGWVRVGQEPVASGITAERDAAVAALAEARGERDRAVAAQDRAESAVVSARAELQRVTAERNDLAGRLAAFETPVPDAATPTAAEVREAQGLLATLGHYDGPADGVPGPRAEAAVRTFQRESLLVETGRLNPATLAALRAVGPGPRPSHGLCTDVPIDRCPPGSSFVEHDGFPEMVVIPADRFKMGSPETEEGRDHDEDPQQDITLASFALARTEVTFDQWAACAADGFCTANREPDDEGWGRGSRPVIYVSWKDAQQFIDWLNAKSGDNSYRLPTEAEWEYAARAGTTTPFAFGDTISTDQANFNGSTAYGNGTTGVMRGKTVPVGDLAAENAWGPRHMHGNVSEWTEDCWRDNLRDQPSNGAAVVSGLGADCSRRVLRGGSWDGGPWDLRSANREWFEPDGRLSSLGFRPARTLTP